MKRFLVLPALCGLLVAAVGLSACTKDGESSGRVTIRFWHSFVSTSRPALQALIERFEDEHPHIRIREQYVPTGDALIQKLMAGIQSGTAPDISWVHADFLGKLAGARAIYPMDHFIRGPGGMDEDDLEDILPGLRYAASWRDTLYAMPMEATSLALFYNKDHFRAAGLDPEKPPRTWEELAEFVSILSADHDGDGRLDRFGFYVPVFSASGPLNIWMVLQWSTALWQAGGFMIDETQTRALYDGEGGVRALEYWRDLYVRQGSPAFSMTHDVTFVAQNVSMIMDGPWDLPRFRQIKDFEWGVAPLPEGPAGRATYLAGEHLAIFRQSRHPEAAWAFVRWITRPDVQAFFSAESGYLPVRKSTLELHEYRAHLEQDPALMAFIDMLPDARPRRRIDEYHVEINRHVAEAIESALVGGEDALQALGRSAAKSNSLLQRMAVGL